MSQLITPSRRTFLKGIGALFAAPAIVRFDSLMKLAIPEWALFSTDAVIGRMDVLYGDLYVRPEWALDEYTERILAPMIARLSNAAAESIMRGQWEPSALALSYKTGATDKTRVKLGDWVA